MNHTKRQSFALAGCYALLLVLFLRTIWGMWDARDITYGDTSSYYHLALEFSRNLTCNIAWSPLYTSFFGAFHWLNPDPYFVVIAHRLVILTILVALIFELSRRLLPLLMAWFVTAWWTVLPIDHSALYEVHLFALIPVLVFWLLLTRGQSVWMRGAAAGLLGLTTVLMRNELLLALAAFGLLSVAYDFWQYRKGALRMPLWRYLSAYAIPAAVAFTIIGFTYWRSDDKFPNLRGTLQLKHTLNVSQIYSYGYGQRHPEYKDNPWIDYQALMLRDFKNDLPTMREAFFANPKAMMEHFLWNASLIPSGLQVALFNSRSGKFNPDYPPTIENPAVATPLSIAWLAVVITGMVLIARNWRYWWEHWIRDRSWVLTGILCVAVTAVVVMIMQRPRPSYLFAFTLSLMWLSAFSLHVIIHHLRGLRVVTPLGWIAALLLAFLVPPYYAQAPPKVETKGKSKREIARAQRQLERQLQRKVERPLLSVLRLLQAHKDVFEQTDVLAGVPGFNSELTTYLGFQKKEKSLFLNTDAMLLRLPEQTSFADALVRRRVRMVIVAPWQMHNPKVAAFVADAEKLGWNIDKGDPAMGEKFFLYTAPEPAPLRQ